jgi:hypothetical protein
MFSSLFRSAIIGVLGLALGLLGGCSALRLGYSQAPELAYWWLDGYVDFTEAQTPQVRESLDAWFKWHRATQLPDYAALLSKGQAQVLDPTTPTQACQWYQEISVRFDVAFERALPAVAKIVQTASAHQLQRLERRFVKTNEELQSDFAQSDPEERAKVSAKRVLDRAEFFYGKLDDAQRETLTKALPASPFDADVWIAERKARQQDLLQTVKRLIAERADIERVQAAVRVLVERSRRSPREAYRAYQQRLTQHNCALAAQIHNLSTPAQRKVAAQKLRGWEDDLRALAGEPPR